MSLDAFSRKLQAATLEVADALIGSVGSQRLYAICLQTADDGMSVGLCANTEEGLTEKQASESEIEEMTPEYMAYLRWAPAEWHYEIFGDAYFAVINRELTAQALNLQGDLERHCVNLINAMTDALANLRASRERALEGVTLFVTISDSDRAEQVERESAGRLNPPELASAFIARFG